MHSSCIINKFFSEFEPKKKLTAHTKKMASTKSQNGKKVKYGEMREWRIKKHLMPDIIMQICRVHKPRFSDYLENEFSHTKSFEWPKL